MERVERLNEELEGRYRIGPVIGKGGMATVCRAEDLRHGNRPDEALSYVEGVSGLDHHHQFHLAEPLAAAGATERAMDLLEEAVKSFHPPLYIESHCPFFESLRREPRFQSIVRKARENSTDFAARLRVGSGYHDEG